MAPGACLSIRDQACACTELETSAGVSVLHMSQARNSSSSSSSSRTVTGTTLQPDSRQVLHLSWLLRAPQPYEDAYWTSREVQMSLARLDVCGHFMSLMALLSLTSVMVSRGAANGILFPASMLVLMVINFMQLCLIKTRPAAYRAWRHRLAVGNRISRLLVSAVPVLRLRSQSVSRFLGPANQHTLGMVLLATVCSFPMMLFYNTLCFVVSGAATLLLQPVATLVCAMLGVHSHPMLEAIPGMQQFANNICSTVRAVFELALHVFVDQGAMPGVPAAGFDAFGTPSRCAGRRTFVQLLLFSNLSLTYFLPVFVTYVVELRHKSQFWQRRGVCIVVQASPLLPFPDNHLVSHACVLCLAPLLLWFLAEFLTPLLA